MIKLQKLGNRDNSRKFTTKKLRLFVNLP